MSSHSRSPRPLMLLPGGGTAASRPSLCVAFSLVDYPKGVTQFLYCRDTAGPPLWGGVLGTDGEDGSGPGRLPGQGRYEADGETDAQREGREVAVPPPGGSNKGRGDREGEDIGPLETEYGRAIRCNAADSGSL